MQGLPYYQTSIREALDELGLLVQRYGGEDSPLGKEKAERLKATLETARQHCLERLDTNLPRIMLYGVYNAGKSTLLNALLGREEASVADKPETYKLTAYSWNGYELLDTPGIDAPIEHEIISREALTRCQVVLFVISAARTFENQAIFEAMRDVVQQGKRLFIVLNDKEARGVDNADMAATRQAVQRNLMAVGFSAEEAAAFRLCVVNAKFALLGRLHKNDKMVEASHILELERLAGEEIRRVNGFAIAADLCAYLKTTFTPFAEELAALNDGETGIRRNDFLNAREEYATFCAALENRIKEACAPLERDFMRCFPAPENLTPDASGMDADSVTNAIRQVWDRYSESVNQLVGKEIERYRHRLAAQLQRILAALPQPEAVVDTLTDGPTLHNICETLGQRPQPEALTVPTVSGNDVSDRVETIGTILGGTSLATAVLKIPLPVLGPLSVPVGLALTILPGIFRALFGKSQAELENERIEAEAAARRHAEEEHARNVALWRQELLHYCQDVARDFQSAATRRASATLEAAFAGVFADVETEILTREASGREILVDATHLQSILDRLSRAGDALRAQKASM